MRRGMTVLAVAAVLIAVLVVWRAQPRAVSVEMGDAGAATTIGQSAPGAEPAGAEPLGSPPLTTAAPGVVVVDIEGRVRRPGVYTLPAGARVRDAVTAAGGLLRRTDPGSVNLARPLVDGEQILISGAVGSVQSAGATGGQSALVNLNTATVSELDALPGVGPVLAQRIVDRRTALGRFASVDELRQVSGIGARKFADLAPLVRV